MSKPCPWRGAGAAAALCALLAVPPGAAADASKAGWWLRVDTKKTEATAIVLQVGANKTDLRAWRTWRAGEPAEFDLPAEWLQAAELVLRATADPDDEDVWFCVYFKGNGVRRFDFDTHEVATLKQAERDRECR